MALLKEVNLKSGKVIRDAFIDDEAFRLPGFLAFRKNDDTIYVAIADIESFSVVQAEKESLFSIIPMFKPLDWK